MNQKRNLGVAETGAGVALLICLLVVIGYLVLHYFGGTAHAPAVEIRPGIVSERAGREGPQPDGDEQPQVLTIESSDAPAGARPAALPGAGSALRTSPESELR
jgi:hypothetical protein